MNLTHDLLVSSPCRFAASRFGKHLENSMGFAQQSVGMSSPKLFDSSWVKNAQKALEIQAPPHTALGVLSQAWGSGSNQAR